MLISSVSRAPKSRRSHALHGRGRLTSAVAVAATTAGLLVGIAFAAAPAAFAVTSNPDPSAGSRNGATRLPFSISGTSSLSVDVGTGNALFSDQLFTLPGVTSDVPVTLTYNSSVWNTATPSAVTNSTGSGWAISGFDERMVTNADNSVTFYGPDGLTGVFTPSTGNTFTAPPQFQADLTGTQSTGYKLVEHQSQETLMFNASGRLTSDADRDHNTTTYSYSNGYPSMIQSSRGPTADQQLLITTTSGRITKLTQSGVGSVTRSVTIGYSANNHLASITDTAGGVTSFDCNPEGSSNPTCDTGQVVHIKSPGKSSTYLTFASGGQVASVSQTNPSIDGGAGESITRLTYPSSTQTLEADPTTNQSQTVANVAHTTYTIGSGNLVTKAVDPDGNTRSDSYTSIGDVSTDSPAAGGTTTYSYESNGESLKSIAAPGGATDSASYGNSGASAYLPSSTTDDANNATKYTYDGSGNQLTTAQGTGQQAKVTYNTNTDGTPSTSASPGAASGQNDNYTYNATTHDLTSIAAPSNSSLGTRSYTYDSFDRLQTATDGAGDTITYTYDNLDRITQVSYSDGTPSVNYTYNATGQITKRVDASGTTTYTYDDLGHLLTMNDTANGNTVSYTWDLAGDLATVTDGLGTTTYNYDAAHELTSMNYPQGSTTQNAVFANNGNGQRTDVWLQSNPGHTVWAAHEQFTYDSSHRITGVLGQNGPATSPTNVENETLCYAATVSPQNCSSGTSAEDRSNVQSTYESVSGETNTYTYDDHDRLTKDVVTGGSNPRTYTYGYDQAGNRTSSTVTGTNPTSQTLTYNAGNQISSTGYTYDGAGNLTTSPARAATFNAAGQQTSTTVSGQKSIYTYAGTNANELTSEYVASQAKTYSYTYGRPDANGIPEVDSVNVSGVGTGYVISDPTGQPVILSTSTGNSCLYLYDGIHNPIGLSTSSSTTAQAFKYDPYGGSTTTNNTGYASSYQNPYTFGEGLLDRATNEVKFGQRYYSPVTGNWTQQDALNAPLDPQNADRYVYAADNPINDTDPTGIFSLGGFFSGVGRVIGGAAAFIAGAGVAGTTCETIFTCVAAVAAAGFGLSNIEQGAREIRESS